MMRKNHTNGARAPCGGVEVNLKTKTNERSEYDAEYSESVCDQ